jgi:hypothetical protein
MRVLRVLASAMFVSGLMILPARAQHGGSHSGGSAGHAAPAFHSSGVAHSSFAPAARFGGYAHGPTPGRVAVRGNGYRTPRHYGYGSAGAIGWVGPGYLSYGDSGPYMDASDTDQGNPDAGDEIAAVPYVDQPPVPAPQESYAPTPYDAPPTAPYQQAPQRPARQSTAEPLPEEDALTIVFKDGRTPLQVHNYMLTTTMLYVRDRGRKDIPLTDVDIAATQTANKNVGVEFQVPGTK